MNMPFQIVDADDAPTSTNIIEIPTHIAAAGDALIEVQPDVSDHAIAQHEESVREHDATVKRDKNNVAFDADIHTGSMLKDGSWRVKRAAKGVASSVAKPATQVANEAQSRAAGAMAAGMVFALGRGFGGEEWAPTAEEVKYQSDAWGAYFIAKNVKDFPPGVALCVAIGAYAAPRFMLPKTKEKVGRARNWLALRVIRWRVNREVKRRGINATVVIRDDEVFVNGQQHKQWMAWNDKAVEPIKKS